MAAEAASKSARPKVLSASIAPSLDVLAEHDNSFHFAAVGAPVRHHGPASAHEYNHFAPDHVHVARSDVFETRFDRVARMASVTPARLADLFAHQPAEAAEPANSVVAANGRSPAKTLAEPAAERFLAYADPSPVPDNGALAAIAAVAPNDDMVDAPEVDELPSAVPLPSLRPRQRAAEEQTEKPEKTEKAGKLVVSPKSVKLAYAVPEDPTKESGGVGKAFRNLFSGRPRAGNGVAVYDISAARVYMPDGSVLEAHSGIGKMADNPNYTHVKMNGPTPAHTYNLRMRETRFHGVEAVRMLPVDGKNKFGRDGFLTHSYLLRGGRAESHGCVAFKDYNKFLAAFKQGKVKQIVVVPGGGSAIARAKRKARDI